MGTELNNRLKQQAKERQKKRDEMQAQGIEPFKKRLPFESPSLVKGAFSGLSLSALNTVRAQHGLPPLTEQARASGCVGVVDDEWEEVLAIIEDDDRKELKELFPVEYYMLHPDGLREGAKNKQVNYETPARKPKKAVRKPSVWDVKTVKPVEPKTENLSRLVLIIGLVAVVVGFAFTL